ncbi:MAG: four-carbon acid sugar kinase family protein [Betaproteobacteria bacterium]
MAVSEIASGIRRVLIIADDLTGTLDAAGPFCDHGFRVKAIVDPDAFPDKVDIEDADVLAINTESRHLSPSDAVSRLESCLRQIDSGSFSFIFKKIDSTMRGNVVVESAAAASYFSASSLCFAPAFPEQGRTVRGGEVLVDNVPLRQTQFVRDALSPAPSTLLTEIFENSIFEHVVLVPAGEGVTPRSSTAFIFDSENNSDLQRAAEFFVKHPKLNILVGSSGVGSQLARLLGENQAVERSRKKVDRFLFVVGSRSERASLQINEFSKKFTGAVVYAPNGVYSEVHLDIERALVLAASRGEVEKGSSAVASALAQSALKIVGASGVDAVFATGGDTALAILREAGASVIALHGNLMPGIPVSSFEYCGRELTLITKAGGFGDANVFERVVESGTQSKLNSNT